MKKRIKFQKGEAVVAALSGAIAVFLSTGIRYREPPWVQDANLLLVGLVLAHAYVVGLVLVRSKHLPAPSMFWRAVRASAIGVLVCTPVAVLVLLGGLEFDVVTLVIEIGFVFFLLLLNSIGLPRAVVFVTNIAVLAIALQPSLSASSWRSLLDLISASSDTNGIQYRFTSLHDIAIRDFQVTPGLPNGVRGGALEVLDGSRLLLVDAHGGFYLLSVDPSGGVSSVPLDRVSVPMNRKAYFRAAKAASYDFRVTDMLLESTDLERERRIYVAHHYWNEKDKCVTLNVDEARLDLGSLNTPLAWQNRFRSTPCIPGNMMITNETGGRLALRSSNSLLLTVGTTLGDELFWDKAAEAVWKAPVDQVSYGKIIEIDRSNWSPRIFTTGHRNPQGLLVDEDEIWSTEHGPNGGDELNRIVEGEDFGWPRSSYGTDYGKKSLTGSNTPGDHSTGQRPIYSWVPSIGISRLIRLKGVGFPAWRDDLLVGSLARRGNGYSLYRVRLIEDRVHVIERIRTDQEVRDLVEMATGQIVTWDGRRIVQIISSAAHIFSECSGCHALNKGWPAAGVGPNLWAIVGSRVANVRGFQYSQAMKEFGGRWSRHRLDEFLRDPQKLVPGTKMKMPGIEDNEKRRKIIEFLEDVSR